ncbi:MAG: hypothetical protein QFX36_05525 [Archaeoglobales archaeon]|nr:hypothetical protein [Archaeoglobales archaeon]
MKINSIEEIVKAIEDLRDLKKNLALDLSGELKVLLTLSRSFKKVYSVVSDFRRAEELFKSLKELGVQNVGIIVSEKIPDFEFRFNLSVSFDNLNETELERLKRISEFVLLIKRECSEKDSNLF